MTGKVRNTNEATSFGFRRRPAGALGGLLLAGAAAALLAAAVPASNPGRAVAGAYDAWPREEAAVALRAVEPAACVATDATPSAAAVEPDLAILLNTLRHSPTGRALLGEAARRGVRVCLDGGTGLLAYYYADRRMVGLSTALSAGARLVFLAHELAHVPQHPAFSDDRRLAPRDLVLLRRLREAAAEAVATRAVWELRQAGFPDAWHDKRHSAYRDVAAAFAAGVGAAEAPGAEALTAATRAAFDQWFRAEWRLRVYDRMTLDHLTRIGRDPGAQAAARRRLDDAFLRRIGRIGGTPFLEPAAGRPLTDAFYAGRLLPDHAAAIARFRTPREVEPATPEAGPLPGALS